MIKCPHCGEPVKELNGILQLLHVVDGKIVTVCCGTEISKTYGWCQFCPLLLNN